MDTELEQGVVERDDAVETAESDVVEDNGGAGAAIAMLIALSSFLLAVVLVLLRHALFGA
ncbi:MAG: hypothetical protein M3Y74_05960 [Chloroflexota bacterium]|nr:hypothetical protein [Chloroflexota bacterium]